MSGGEMAELALEAKMDTTVRMFTSASRKEIDLEGWEKVDGLQFRYNDGGKTLMQVYQRKLKKGETVDIPQGNWTGCMLLMREDAKSAQR
jgi:hypothetical protein